MAKNKNAMSRNGRRIGTKTKSAKLKNVEAYYKRFRNGNSRHVIGSQRWDKIVADAEIRREAKMQD